MKRHKRDRQRRASSRGYRAGVAGKSQDICPYDELTTREEWLGGWRDGWKRHKMDVNDA